MTEEEFNNLKQESIKIVRSKYNEQKTNLYFSTVNRIYKYSRSNLSKFLKRKYINNLIRVYYNTLAQIDKEMNEEILLIEQQVYVPEPEPEPEVGRKNALIIGTNYPNTQYKLRGCVNDTIDLLKYTKYKNYNVSRVLSDNTRSAVRKNILEGIRRLLVSSKAGDTLFLTYSGHGTYVKDKDNNELIGYDQVLVPSDFKLIVDDELKPLIQKHLKKDVTLVALFDCCFSGSILDLKYTYMDSIYGNGTNTIANNQETETSGNVIMISGSSDIQTSADAYINGKWQGAMTWSFMRSIAVTNTWKELLQHMRNLLSRKGFTQIPQLSSGKLMDINTAHNM